MFILKKVQFPRFECVNPSTIVYFMCIFVYFVVYFLASLGQFSQYHAHFQYFPWLAYPCDGT